MAENVAGPPVGPLLSGHDAGPEIKADVHVKICTPSHNGVTDEYAHCLMMSSLRFCQTDFVRDGKNLTKAIGRVNVRGSILPALRESTARQCLISGTTHMLWIDSDMVFPADIIHRLWKHDLDVVGANCPRKMLPTIPTCEKIDGGKLWTLAGSTGLEETRRIGFGILMMKVEVFKDLPEPWFPFTYDYKVRGYDGEDTNFCRALQAKGIRMWVDHDLSKEIRHTGPFNFEHCMCEEWSGGVSESYPVDQIGNPMLQPLAEKPTVATEWRGVDAVAMQAAGE